VANLATPEDCASSTPPIAAHSDTALLDTTLCEPPVPPQISIEEALTIAANKEPAFDTTEGNKVEQYCLECYLPLHPDPKPEQLFIFLHALKYTTSLGEFSTEMPEWAEEGWSWDRT
jgi:hypothetical protein